MDKSPWKVSGRFIAVLAIAFGSAFLGMQILPLLAASEKPQGNRLALLECRICLNAESETRTNSANFEFSKLSDDSQRKIVIWGHKLNFLIKTNFVWGTSSNRHVVIVCEREFDNVHKSGFWNSFWHNPAHAVGYSDGTTGLISPEQFTNLNLSGFVSTVNLATNSKLNIFK